MATSDSSLSTPTTPLTPNSTGTTLFGTCVSAPGSPANPKPLRRKTVFYPNASPGSRPLKPFSRSAAKRESVMMLGSIEHLQQYFKKTGLSSRKNPLEKRARGLVPAIGSLESLPSPPSSLDEQLIVPVPEPRSPTFVRTFDTDPDSLLPGVIEDLIAVTQTWRIDEPHPDASSAGANSLTTSGSNNASLLAAGNAKNAYDILDAMKITARAIRSIRNYMYYLPDESVGTRCSQFRSSIMGHPSIQSHRIQNVPPSSSSLTSSSAAVLTSPSPSTAPLFAPSNLRPAPPIPPKKQDPMSLVRRAAIDLLSVLRDLEERSRLPLTDDAYDAQSDISRGIGSSRSRVNSLIAEEHLGQADEPGEGHDVRTEDSSGNGEPDLDPDASFSFSLIHVQGRLESVPVWEDHDSGDSSEWEDDVTNTGGYHKKKGGELWEERLVLGNGWLYRKDMELEELEAERGAVKAFLDVVDEVLFEGAGGDAEAPGTIRRGWVREQLRRLKMARSKTRRASAGVGESSSRHGEGSLLDSNIQIHGSGHPQQGWKRVNSTGVVDAVYKEGAMTEEPEGVMGCIAEEGAASESEGLDEELPVWARRSLFENDELARAHALLSTFLPDPLHCALSPTSIPRAAFLESLSSGQLLCVAYNACVRRSGKPWGYVSRDAIHDIVALEEEASSGSGGGTSGTEIREGLKKGWTFRRTDNLRLWAGALKIRYLIPIQSPTQNLSMRGAAPTEVLRSYNNTLNNNTNFYDSHDTKHNNTSNEIKRVSRSAAQALVFDAKLIANKDEGWEDMLEGLLILWVRKAVEEARGKV